MKRIGRPIKGLHGFVYSRVNARLIQWFRGHVVALCRVCQIKTDPFQLAYGKFWYKCPECGFLQAEIDKDTRKELIRGEGFSAGTGVGGGGYREYYIAKLCHDELGLRRILLYGTGKTPTFCTLREQGMDVYGCDLSLDLIAFRREEYGEGCFFHPGAFPDKQFDVIVAVEVFEHLISPMRTLRLLKNHLSTYGIIGGTTDFYHGGDISDHIYLSPKLHVAYWNRQSLEAAANMLNLELALFELECPGSVKPDEKYGLLWPRKRVFFLYPERYREYFSTLLSRYPILPIDRP